MSNLDFPRVVADTSTMNHEEWLKARHRGIGGSDAAAILGVSPWTSRYTLWQQKVADEPTSIPSTPAMAFGHRMEPYVAETFADLNQNMTVVDDLNLYAHPEYEFMQANLDRLIVEEGKPSAILEIKTSARPQSWIDGVPGYYVSQVQHYMAVTNIEMSYVAVLLNGQDLKTFEVPRNDKYINILIEKEAKFWEDVKKLIEPDVDGSESTFQAIRKSYEASAGKKIELPATAQDLFDARATAKKLVEEYTEEVRRAEAEIMKLLGDSEVGTIDGKSAVTWKEQTRVGVDSKRLKEEYPEVAEAVSKESSFRVLRVNR